MSCDFAALGKVIRNRGRFMVVDPLAGDAENTVYCCTPIISVGTWLVV
jgi:hypothetical protein